MIRTLYLVFSVFPAADLPADGAPPEKGGAPAVKPGIAIEFHPRQLAESDRTPQGELKAILAATATLKTERPILYRSTVLPPGAYPVRVAGEEGEGAGRNLFFVIGPVAGAPREAAAIPAAVKPEEKKPEKDEEKPGASKGAGGQGRAAGRAAAKALPGQIRALFHLASAAKASESVEFEVRQTRRGDRFTLTVKAGTSQGKATLRFLEDK